ncbi:MAG: glycosyltransferase [Rhodocyclaceae bacterium]|nr:glycosyltransferase [Rhodocyclaceae bacterium]
MSVAARTIDVIVPVYRGLDHTRACIEAVRSSRRDARCHLVVIDDASPEAEVAAYVDALVDEDDVTVLRNPTNRGFVATVNRGMALHPIRDVVLLNSDTRVAGDWLARLERCAYSRPRVATVTPFSNSATVCSYPFDGWHGGVPGELGLEALDALFAQVLSGEAAELPTAVGFCMYIRRDALRETGPFDEERFGRGYGEENDFCLRGSALGWQHLLAADVFVFHEGGVSFGEERTALQREAHERLLARHPDYLDRVAAFMARDPLAGFRGRIDRARSALGAREEACVLRERGRLAKDFTWPAATLSPPDPRPVQLHVAHGWGGGISRWIDDFHAADSEHRNLVLQSVSHRNAAGFRLELREPGRRQPLASRDLSLPIRACSFDHPEYRAFLDQVIAFCGARRLIVSSLIGHSLDVLDTGLPSALVLHDMFPFCPALFGHFRRDCRQCTEADLEACLGTNPSNVFWHNTTALDWLQLRQRLAGRIRMGALALVSPSRSMVERWHALMPEITADNTSIVPHGIDLASLGPPLPTSASDGRLRLVVPGRLAPHKGLDLLAEALPGLMANAQLLLLGAGDFGRCFAGLEGVQVVPDYDADALGDHLRTFAPDAALLLSPVPESFSYTLSEMQALAIPVIATRGGAFSERVADGRTGFLVDADVSSLLAALAKIDKPRLRAMRTTLARITPIDRRDSVAAVNALLAAGDEPAACDPLPLMADALTDLRLRHDLGARARIRLEAAVHHERGSRALCEARSVAPSAAARPVTRHPRIAELRGDRTQIRARIHYWLGIPDAMRVVLHPGDPDDPEAAQRLLAATRRFVTARNEIAVVVTRSDGFGAVWQALARERERLTTTRRLFFVPKAPEDASWLLACEVLLASTATMADRFADAASEAGILTCHVDRQDGDTITDCIRQLERLPAPPAGLNL